MVTDQFVGRTILSVISSPEWADTIVCPTWGLLAQQSVDPVLERLDPPKRLFVIMAIIFIAVVGLLLVTCTMLGARWVRGVARQKPRPPRLDNSTVAAAENRNLRESLDGMLPQVDPNETIHVDREKGETEVDP